MKHLHPATEEQREKITEGTIWWKYKKDTLIRSETRQLRQEQESSITHESNIVNGWTDRLDSIRVCAHARIAVLLVP